MSQTQVLLQQIAALRQRLEKTHKLAPDARAGGDGSEPAAGMPEPGPVSLQRLMDRVNAGGRSQAWVDTSLHQIQGKPGIDEKVWPNQLTARARRLLHQGRELLGRLRGLADRLAPDDDADPLAENYRLTVSMADALFRTVQAFPDAATAQLRLCEGLEGILALVAERIAAVAAAVDRRQGEAERLDRLTAALAGLHSGEGVALQPFVQTAEEVVADARQGGPLRFLHAPADQPAPFIACHSLTVAQVMARLVHLDPDLRGRGLEPILAALVHDAGMLDVPAAVLGQTEPLTIDQRRIVEGHTRVSAYLATRLLPAGAWLAEACASHHERPDGTGYPSGLQAPQMAPLTRLLAVCDTYAALCAPRPHRPALDPRTALTDTLLLADNGGLDRFQAERLLHLGFYPAGSVVELADRSLALVVAAHPADRGLNTPGRPVLALLTDEKGLLLPGPRHVDLVLGEGYSIVRTLPETERRKRVGHRYPELAL